MSQEKNDEDKSNEDKPVDITKYLDSDNGQWRELYFPKESHIYKVDIISKNNLPEKANKISMMSFWLNAVLAVITLSLFWTSYQGVQEAVEANKLNKRIFDSTRLDQQNKQLTEQSDREWNYKRDTTGLGISGRGLTAQGAALTQAQKDFLLESRAFLQITDVNVDTSIKNVFTIKYNLFNTGKFPAAVTFTRVAFLTGDTSIAEAKRAYAKIDLKNNPGIFINHRYTVISGQNHETPGYPFTDLDPKIMNEFNNGNVWFYMFIDYEYSTLSFTPKYDLKQIIRFSRRPTIHQIRVDFITYDEKQLN